jgi:hypothetical protein
MYKLRTSRTAVVLLSSIFLAVCLLGQEDDARNGAVKFSTLPSAQQSGITDAIRQWGRQFKWHARTRLAEIGGASVTMIQLGPPNEHDLVVTDQSGCSPTGNCPILLLRPDDDHYHVILEATAQSFTTHPNQAHGFREIVFRMHGSATESTVREYRFDGKRYIRSSCYNEIYAVLNRDGNLQELSKPRTTPCR